MIRQLAAALLLIPSCALAGTPVSEDMTCPIGGDVFTITSTTSCSYSGRTMSFRPMSSCDFITRLPVCPSNGLPVYRDFESGDLARIEALMQTPVWDNLRETPPWPRAYGLAREVDGEGSEQTFGIMLSMFWYDPDALLNWPGMVDAFLVEAEAELARAPVGDRPYLQALTAYMLLLAGRERDGDAFLAAASTAPNIPDVLQTYLARIEACRGDFDAEGCRLQDPIEAP